MPFLCGDCPRCGTQKVTFDVPRMALQPDINYGWQHHAEAFAICRHCSKSAVFLVKQTVTSYKDVFCDLRAFVELRESLNNGLEIVRPILLRDREARICPAHLPSPVEAALKEAFACVTVQCWTAAGAMFRKGIDLATAPLLPSEDIDGLNGHIRRTLGARIPWLIKTGRVAKDLEGLAQCLREDGNDAAHLHFLAEHDALDLQDFAVALFERMFTEPGKLQAAEKRRSERRQSAA